jgi:acyl-coenzyme A synthetase/AMP-(fatty) acid ligase
VVSSFSPFPAWKWEIPEFFNIGVACTDAHLGTPVEDRVAMIVEDDTLGTSSITYRELAERTGRFARLLADLGLKRGDRVLVRLPNSIDYPTAFLGAMKLGAIAVPTSTLLTADEVRYLVEDSGAAAIVIDRPAWEAMRARLEGAGNLRHVILGGAELERALAAVAGTAAPARTRPDDPAYLVYTSGTTGYPKGVLHGHRSLIGRSPASTYWFDFDPDVVDRIMHSGKFNWTYVLGSALMDPLYRGKTVIAHEGRNDASTWPRLIA